MYMLLLHPLQLLIQVLMFHDCIHALLLLLHLSLIYRGRKHCGEGVSSAYLIRLPVPIKILGAGPDPVRGLWGEFSE